MELLVTHAGLPLVVGDVVRSVRCGVGAPFLAVVSGRWRGVDGGRLMRRRCSAAAHVGYRTVIIVVHAWGPVVGDRKIDRIQCGGFGLRRRIRPS